MSANHPNPHQPWCDLNLYEAETVGATWRLSENTEHTTGTRTNTTTLQRTNDGTGTSAFIPVLHDDPWTLDDFEALASYLTDLAGQIRE
ncbi:hypothetical protein [Arthrobacter sp.]|uniref:hypothetical protein n=1 Tax=Arthrobacter sp. TaxID=1667 RepID=UPI003A8EED55